MSSGALEARCIRRDIEVRSSGARELGGVLRACRCRAMELGSLGGALQAYKRAGIELWRRDAGVREVWSFEALEVPYGRETWRYGAREARSGRVGVEESELGGSGVVLQECRRGGRSSGALEARCKQTWRHGDRELWRGAAGV